MNTTTKRPTHLRTLTSLCALVTLTAIAMDAAAAQPVENRAYGLVGTVRAGGTTARIVDSAMDIELAGTDNGGALWRSLDGQRVALLSRLNSPDADAPVLTGSGRPYDAEWTSGNVAITRGTVSLLQPRCPCPPIVQLRHRYTLEDGSERFIVTNIDGPFADALAAHPGREVEIDMRDEDVRVEEARLLVRPSGFRLLSPPAPLDGTTEVGFAGARDAVTAVAASSGSSGSSAAAGTDGAGVRR